MSVVSIDKQDYLISEDGVTHLNVYSKASTELGRWLSNFEQVSLSLPEGEFESLEGYYHYLKILHSLKTANVELDTLPYDIKVRLIRLQRSHGKTAQTIGRDIKQRLIQEGVRIQNRPTEEFNRLFENALRLKLESNVEMFQRLQSAMEDGIPLVHYYVMPDSKPHYRKRFDWLCDRIYAVL